MRSAEVPEITIITPCHDAARFLQQTVDSVLRQSYADWEWIVVDDGSTDTTPELLAGAARADDRISVITTANRGVAAARNTGIDHANATSEFVIFLDADDVWEPDTLSTLRSRLVDEDHLTAAFGLATLIDEHGGALESDRDRRVLHRVKGRRVIRDVAPREVGFEHIVAITPFSTPGQCLIRRRRLMEVGGFDSALVPCEDWDLWLRLATLGRFGFVDRPVLQYRQHGAQASGRHSLMQAQRKAVYDELAGRRLPAELLRQVRIAYPFGMYGFDARICAAWCRDAVSSRRLRDALVLAVRAGRYRLKAAAARMKLRIRQ